MPRSVRLRRWQKRALDLLAERRAGGATDVLCVATPGAGKTTLALTAAARSLGAAPGQRLVVVAPTSHLKVQWATAAERFGLVLEPAWSSAAPLPPDAHGVVVTYQQVASDPDLVRARVAGAFVVLDELHHAGDERSWGDAVRHAFETAGFRLALSGTPFRSDTRSIPFVRYTDGVEQEARPDFEYGYADALRDGRVVRPVYFPRIGGFMEWQAPDGAQLAASFDDALDRTRSAQRLRTALSLEGEWLPAVLGQAHQQLLGLRREQADAGGLVIAADQEHARGIADLLDRRFRARAVVVTSDDPLASSRIARFAASDQPWIVAVRMVSEGVDIPRLRIGVYATTTTTELFFRQAVGRFVRWTGRAPREKAYLFIPDDPRLRLYAHTIAEARRHSLRREAVPDRALDDAEDPTALDDLGEEQLSLFSALSAVATDGPHPVASVFDEAVPEPDDDGDDDPDLVVEVPPMPLPDGQRVDAAGPNPRQLKSALRRHNAGLAAELVRFTGLSHREVNGKLNRLVGVTKIDEASVAQLEKRAQQAQRWLSSL